MGHKVRYMVRKRLEESSTLLQKKAQAITRSYWGAEYGMHDTNRETFNVSGGNKRFDYSVGGSYLKTHGISAASSGSEDDGYDNFTGSSRLGLNFMGDGRVDVTAKGFSIRF